MNTTLRRISLWATMVCAFGCGGNNTKPTKTIPLGAVLARTGIYGSDAGDNDTDLAVSHMNAALAKVGSEIRFGCSSFRRQLDG